MPKDTSDDAPREEAYADLPGLPVTEPEPGATSPAEVLGVEDFESEQAYVLFASVYGGDAPRLLSKQTLPASESMLALVNPALSGKAVSFAGCLPIGIDWMLRWIWMWEQARRLAELRERIRGIVRDPDLSGEEKTRRIRELLDQHWTKVALPLGPRGLRYDHSTKRRFAETIRGPSSAYVTHADIAGILRDSARRLLETVVNATLGHALNWVGIDAGEILSTGASTFVDKLDIRGAVHAEATWSQLWVYPVDQADASKRLIDSKVRAALLVALRVADAVDPRAFGGGDELRRIDAQIAPVLGLLRRLFQEPKKLLLDILTGQFDPSKVTLPDPGAIRSAASRIKSGIEDLVAMGGPGMACTRTRTQAGNREALRRACARTVYFGLFSGPERFVVGPNWPGAIELYAVEVIDVQVLPESSEVFLKHHGLFYTADLEVSYRTDLEAVLKEALEETARAMLRKTAEKVRDALTPEKLKDFLEWLRGD